MPRTVKVAVVGSGLAGLTAAYLLSTMPSSSDVTFEVHLFEKSSTLGMDAHSVSVSPGGKGQDRDSGGGGGGGRWRVDVPMRSFQGGYYPQLIALYRKLGVHFRQADFSYSFSLLSTPPSHDATSVKRRIRTTFIYNGASGRRGIALRSSRRSSSPSSPSSDPTARLASSWRSFSTLFEYVLAVFFLLANYIRLAVLSAPLLQSSAVSQQTFRQWSDANTPQNPLARWIGWDESWRDFAHDVLIPLFSAVCTAPEEDVLEHPVEEFLDYIWRTLFTHHYVVTHGVQDVVSRLSAPIRHIHTSSPIVSIEPSPSDPSLISITAGTSTTPLVYDGFAHLIMATQANQAATLLQPYASRLAADSGHREAVEAQIAALKQWKYCATIVVNHMDETLLPDSPGDRRDLNLITADVDVDADDEKHGAMGENCLPPSYTMATHILRPKDYPAHLPPVYQTTDPIVAPRSESVLSVAHLERAVLTLDSKRALEGLCAEPARRRWQCVGAGASDTALGRLQGAGRLGGRSPSAGIWLCGSYASRGIPLLEGCVVSARTVVEQGVFASEGVAVLQSPW